MSNVSQSIDHIGISLRSRIADLASSLCTGLYERELPMNLALLAALSGESIFLLGPPGVAKSLIARRLKYAFKNGTSFEYLMSKFSTPDEIFGPVSIKKLKEEDRYERLTDRYLPGANIVFLDEIWKAGPAIQNALLTILNEKIYRNGEVDISVDIKVIITASNELPSGRESQQPLWDRLLIRYYMTGVRENRNFLKLITDTQDVYDDPVAEELKISNEELDEWDQQIHAVEVPPEVLNTIQVIRHKIDQYNEKPNRETDPIRVYDRRWKKLIRLLRTSAFLNGRKHVDLMDCFLSVHCLWSHPNQLDVLKEIVSETIRKHGYTLAVSLNQLRREIEEFDREVDEETRIKNIIAEDKLMVVQEEYYEFVLEDKPFHGDLIKITEFNKLARNDYEVINIYDKSLTLRHRLKAKKSDKEHAIDIMYNSVTTVFDLKTAKKERKEVIYKKPHHLVEKHWNERFDQLNEYIRKQQLRLNEDAPQEIQYLRENLFVKAELSEIVLANMKEVAAALDDLQLRLEKIQYAYTSL